MGIITNLEEERGYIRIEVEGRFFLKIRKKYIKEALVVRDDLDEESFLDRVSCLQQADAYESALTMLDFSARTRKEIEVSLKRKGFVPGAVESTVARLIENRLINDQEYAIRMAETKKHKPVGLYAMKRKLRAKGLSDSDMDEALSVFDEEQQAEAAKAMLQKLMPKYEGVDPRAARGKLTAALARRGFSYDAISSAFLAFEEMDELSFDE